MRKEISTTLAVIAFAVALFTLSAFTFSNQNTTAVSKTSKINKSGWVEFHRTGTTFWSDGAIETSGTWIMNITFTGSAIHCVNTLTSSEGTLVMLSNCNFTTMRGRWFVLSGTGDYAGMKGNGSLTMNLTVSPATEDFVGTIR